MLSHSDPQIQAAYRYCQDIVRGHYENFPVASFLLPKELRQPIAVIYAFARTADDFADEGNQSEQKRLEQLDHYDDLLNTIDLPQHDNLIFIALQNVINNHQLPVQLFRDLLSAFKQDVTKHRYTDFDELLDYCSRSANPVGRLLLHLTKNDSAENLHRSDLICSSLQLINFLQDITQDYSENNRIYLPQDEMEKYGVSESTISHQTTDDAMRTLFEHQINRTKIMMLEGSQLGTQISGKFGLQLRMMINGGLQVLKLLENNKENVYARPRLGIGHWLNIASYSLLKKYIQR